MKKQVYYFFAGIVVIIVGCILGINFYNDYKYKQTTESKLVEKGYSIEEAKKLEEKLTSEKIEKLLQEEKNENIIKLINEKFFLLKNIDAYLEYMEKEEEKSVTDIVAIVNTHANNKWYQVELETDISLKEKMNVNKFYALSKDYVPENMKNISLDYSYGSLGDNKLIDYAYEKFIDLWNAANDNGHYLMVQSSYRDYKSQKEIYDYRKSTQGERKADQTVARPGHSEHQTGLVIDLSSKNAPTDEEFKESEAYKWLKENAYQYGFIERYPEGKTYITGYSPESWHWRYVGIEAATTMHKENITYDEYYAFYIES